MDTTNTTINRLILESNDGEILDEDCEAPDGALDEAVVLLSVAGRELFLSMAIVIEGLIRVNFLRVVKD